MTMTSHEGEKDAKKWYKKVPHVFTLLIIIIFFCTLLTYIIPAGEFNRVSVEGTSREIVVAGSYHNVESSPISLLDMFKAIPEGFAASSSIIAMILFSSGAFAVMSESGAIENILSIFLKRSRKKKQSGIIVIWTSTFLFSILGIFIGPEVHVPFTVITVAIALGLGYDAIVGIGILLGGAVGFSTAPINAAVIGTCDAISGLPLFSGMGLRTVFWFCSTVATCIVITLYANKIKKNPKKSYVYGLDTTGLELLKEDDKVKVSKRQYGVLLCLLGIFITTIIGCIQFGWYLEEMTAVFIIGGILAGFIAGFNSEKIAQCFINGATNVVFGALCVGIARGIQIVLENGHIADTIIQAAAEPLTSLPTIIGAIAMTIIQALINFLIPSGSGQAAATMPIMFPIGDLLGITKQTSILIFQIGAGIPDLLYPTVGSLMAVCALAKVPFEKWARFAIKLSAVIFLLGWIFVMIAIAIHWGPF